MSEQSVFIGEALLGTRLCDLGKTELRSAASVTTQPACQPSTCAALISYTQTQFLLVLTSQSTRQQHTPRTSVHTCNTPPHDTQRHSTSSIFTVQYPVGDVLTS
ncbi:hypothetical protein E2C01_061458 [Portunus trituberculatus]|uniref:Uncharacterized protein n=1 Tax=Portunus trituberculatus TaxID=210409 RepID=A0A5B7HCG6_PORTR|nr:hypothetical protein [Portunus trituberculatus]